MSRSHRTSRLGSLASSSSVYACKRKLAPIELTFKTPEGRCGKRYEKEAC